MNCRECEPLIVESARYFRSAGPRAPEDRKRRAEISAALEHAASCPSCADRLHDERDLTLDLRDLAAASADAAPSLGCEAILMAAYRTERGREVRARRWIFAVSGAMVASLVVLLGAALLLSRESGNLVDSMASRLSGRPARAVSDANASDAAVLSAENVDAEQEDVTDFVSFYPGADTSTVDAGALVRVRVPSSALSSFGVNMAQAREEEWVNADLLVAEDGSPVAIRFVRPAPQVAKD